MLAWLDSEPTSEMVAEYRESATEQEGSVEPVLKLDEAAMRRGE